jgi:hypothetical protein
MVQDCSIAARPGGKQHRIDEAAYEKLRDLLLEGWKGARGETLGFWSVEHGISKNDLIKEVVKHMDVTCRTAWANLRRLYPKLQMMQERVKKMRTHADAQLGARQILGLSPLVYPAWVPKDLRDQQSYWVAQRIWNQWLNDAFTIEPRKELAPSDVIGWVGGHREAVESPISNAGVATLPKMMVYIALHPYHGLRWWWSVTGCNMGKKDAYNEFRTYAADLSPEAKSYIAAFTHMNYKKVVATHAAFKGPNDAAGRATTLYPDFHEDLMLVRASAVYSCAPLTAASIRAAHALVSEQYSSTKGMPCL